MMCTKSLETLKSPGPPRGTLFWVATGPTMCHQTLESLFGRGWRVLRVEFTLECETKETPKSSDRIGWEQRLGFQLQSHWVLKSMKKMKCRWCGTTTLFMVFSVMNTISKQSKCLVVSLSFIMNTTLFVKNHQNLWSV